jgi:DNA-binding CsgD family transcriptional regulator
MSKKDFINIVEIAYHVEADDKEWLLQLAESADPLLGREFGIIVYDFNFSHETGPLIGTPISTGPECIVKITSELLKQAPAGAVQSALGVKPGFYLASDRVRGKNMDAFQRILSAECAKHGVNVLDHDGVIAAEPTGFGVVIGSYASRTLRTKPMDKARWAKAAVHIATGLRLRRVIMAGLQEEAILSPDGKCEHAEEGAKSNSSREALRDAVKAIDKARGRERLRDQDRALAIWKGLCSGRWSLVDRFESDGRRYVVAFRNDPRLKDPRALTSREMQVAAYAALGHSNKLMAYALGLSQSTVAWHMARAMQKLGAMSRADLIRLFAAFGGIHVLRNSGA